MSTRKHLVWTVLAVCLAGILDFGSALADEPAGDRPNVVIIQVDDLGWRDLGCMGSPVYETPHIDKLARSGLLMTDGYAGSPLCTPSRAVLLTGSQPTRHGMYTVVKNRRSPEQWKVLPEENNHYMPKGYPTLGGVMSEAGIANGSIGKWHISVSVPAHGFAEGKWGGYLGLPINYFAPFKLGFLPQDVPEGAYLPEYIREAGVDFIDRHKDEPFFLYFNTYLPHDEIKNDDEDSTLDAPDAVIAQYEAKIAKMREAGEDLQGHDNPVYAAMIEETDNSVGAIMDKLAGHHLLEKTLVIFVSDNGGHRNYTSNAPLRGSKGGMYEGGIRVPMIFSMPGRINPGVSHEPVSAIDFYPTICRFMGVEPTDSALVDGEDLSGLVFEGERMAVRSLFWNFPCYGSLQPPRSALRRGDWKIIHHYEDNSYTLFNLEDDIGESNDLTDSRPKELLAMKQYLHSAYERFGAVTELAPNPEYDPTTQAPADEMPVDNNPVSSQAAYELMGLPVESE